MYSTVSGYLTTGVTVGFNAYDIVSAKDDLNWYATKVELGVQKEATSIVADEAANVAGEFADPEVDTPLIITLQAIGITIDVILTVFSVASTVVTMIF